MSSTEQGTATYVSGQPALTLTLQAPIGALATILWYLTEKRANRICGDEKALNNLLDRPDLADWLERATRAGLVDRTAFINYKGR